MAELERDWFRTRFAGQRAGYLYCSDDDLDAEFSVDSADAESDYAAYIREIGVVRQLLCQHSLDEVYLDPRRNTEMTLRWGLLGNDCRVLPAQRARRSAARTN
jgi:hypothetical protein